MLLHRTLALIRPTGLRNMAQMSTRPRSPGLPSVFQQPLTANNFNENKNRSYSWLFQEPKGRAATIRVSENERGETVFEGSSLPQTLPQTSRAAPKVTNRQNNHASFDFLFTEPTSPFGNESAIGEVNRTKSSEYLFQTSASTDDQSSLYKAFHSVVQQTKQNQVDEDEYTEEDAAHVDAVIHAMNRNARAPKKANRGRRPCSHVARRLKRMKRHKGW